jgi:diguanylate cyclase (GGDEF)-like protein
LDLDHFKDVNDAYGHLVGSRVLAQVGGTLRQVIPGGALAARYGGDEFVVVVPGAGPQETLWVAETVRRNIETAVFLDEADPVDPVNYPALSIRDVVTCSLGISTLQRDVRRDERLRAGDFVAVKNELMRRADTRMYLAKDRGRNRIVAGGE